MIILPWYFRFGIDCMLITAPLYILHKHPTLFFEYFQDKRRVTRRRSLETQNELYGQNMNALMDKEEAQAFYNELGIQYK